MADHVCLKSPRPAGAWRSWAIALLTVAMIGCGTAGFAAETDTPAPQPKVLAPNQGLLYYATADGALMVEQSSRNIYNDITGMNEVLAAQLKGQTLDGEAVEGAVDPLPEGTIWEAFELTDSESAVIKLNFPDGKLACDCFGGPDADRLTRMIQQSLINNYGIRNLEILVKEQDEPDSNYMDLVDRLLGTQPRVSKDVLDGTVPKSGAAPKEIGTYPTTGNVPSGFLSGKGVFINQAHGAVYRSKTNTWGLQRSLLLELNEDIHNAELVNWFLAAYLRNAGAQVWPEREMDFNTNMVIVDSDEGTVPASKGVCTQTGSWTTTSGKGFKVYTPPLRDENMPFRAGTGSYQRATLAKGTAPTATAVFTPNLAAEGYYQVYMSFVGASDQSTAAHIGVRHTGGESTIHVNQTRDGNTWLWLGRFHFDAGQNPDKGAVVVYNDVAAGDPASYVCIDAVRFGGGNGEIQRYDPEYFPSGPWVGSGKARWQEDARYYLQFTGMTASLFDSTCYESTGNASANQRDECDGWSARSRYVSYETEAGEDTCYVALHTNASTGDPSTATARGLSTYVTASTTSPPSAATLSFRNYVHDQIYSDVMATYAPSGWRNSKNSGSYGENNQANLGDSPGFLIELLFHDNTDDCNLYKDPKFRQMAARAIYKGIVKYYANRDGVTPRFLPEPPTHVSAVHQSDGSVRVSWHAPVTGGVNGDAATGYIVQRSLDGKGFDDGEATTAMHFDFTNLDAGAVHYFRVIANNQGGDSFPSEVLAVRTGVWPAPILFVNGNDRVDRYTPPLRSWFGVQTRFMDMDVINTFNYVIQHAEALHNAGATFDSASHGAVAAGDINLQDYDLVIWASGQQAEADTTVDKLTFRAFTAEEKTALRSYAEAGGNLFVTGSEIWWDMDRSSSVPADDRNFVNTVLASGYAADSGTSSYKFTDEAGSIFDGLGQMSFDDGTHGVYNVRFPEALTPLNGASACLRYVSGSSGTDIAGIQSLGGASRVIALGVPFEAIYPESARNAIMQRVVSAMASVGPTPTPSPIPTPSLTPSPSPTPSPTPNPSYTRFEDFESGTVGNERMFRGANWSGSTRGVDTGAANAVTSVYTNNAVSALLGAPGSQSYGINFTWTPPIAADAKARCTSYSVTGNTIDRPNPMIDLTQGLGFYVKVVQGEVDLTIWVRETGGSGPIGGDGGTTGSVKECLNVKHLIPSYDWQYVYFDLQNSDWVAISGSGPLTGTWGSLESLIVYPADGTSQLNVELYVDDFFQGPTLPNAQVGDLFSLY